MKLVVDRLEESFIVCEECESGKIINLDKALFPEDIASGNLVELTDGIITIIPNEETHERIKEKMDNLWT